jgi:hypothetical protein
MKIALDCLPKETIDDYAGIESTVFGEILVQALGINGSCWLFKHSKHAGRYILGWVTDDGEAHDELFDLDTIMGGLKGKSATLTMDVYTRT